MYTLGIDIGSTSSKAVILEDGKTIVKKVLITVGTGTSGPAQLLQSLFDDQEIQQKDLAKTVVTGYGRMNWQGADKQISELSCHARGVQFFSPNARTVIDIGGQDSKALRLDERGMLLNFSMNDKCAAGTGRFLDVMANVLETQVSNLSTLSEEAKTVATISSVCTVFAESEVISHLSKGTNPADIVAGIHRSVAQRVSTLAFKVGLEKDVVMTGGVAQNRGVVTAMEEVMKVSIQVSDYPQYTGAIGAAIYAFDEAEKENRKRCSS
jgi:(R)-2-hydroxyacyl-CoA dehydratese activating ATPase